MSDPTQDIKGLYRIVAEQLKDNLSLKASETLDQILNLNPNDKDAIYSKSILSIQLDQFQIAINHLNKLDSGSNVNYAKAYSLYRLNQFNQSLEILKNETGRQSDVLKAQVYLKLEQFDECIEIYERLIQSTDQMDNEYAELVTNLQAARAGAVQKNFDYHLTKEIESVNSYEYLYNTATIHLFRGDYDLAESTLIKAIDVCKNTIIDEEELDMELSPLYSQLGYLYHITLRSNKAMECYTKVESLKEIDSSYLALIKFNQQLINPNLNLIQLLNMIIDLTHPIIMDRLTLPQRKVIYLNHSSLLLKVDKGGLAQKKATKADKLKCGNLISPLVKASILIKSNRKEKAITLLKNLIKQNPMDFSSHFALSQLYIETNEIDNAIKTLESLRINYDSDLPGLVGILVKLYEKTDKFKQSIELLDNLSNKESDFKSIYIYQKCLQLIDTHLNNNQPKKAIDLLNELIPNHHQNDFLVAKLVLATSLVNPDQADQYLNQLIQVPNVEVDHLNLIANKIKSNERIIKINKDTKKCRRKNKPNKTSTSTKPDPQRWLPLKDRTAYKKMAKKLGKNLRGNQGINVQESKEPEVETKIEVKEEQVVVKPKKIKKKVIKMKKY